MKVFLLCPAATTSGGPEALHQLAGALRQKGVDAAIVYYPFNGQAHPVPAPYRHYDVAVRATVEDHADAVVVVPEVATSLAWRFPKARKAIWWLSIDNYFKWQHINPGPSAMQTHPDLMHLCQSQYAFEFLSEKAVGPLLMLTDFLSPAAFTLGPAAGRLPVVAYNPKKAPETTKRLIARHPGPTWIPLENLDQTSLADLLREVRVYADFGPHPGRDRIPREAALCGAVVVTGRRGAAACSADIPLPDRFRLDERLPDFEARAHRLMDELLGDDAAFQLAWDQQAPYREWIGGNRDVFLREVDGLIAAMARDRRVCESVG